MIIFFENVLPWFNHQFDLNSFAAWPRSPVARIIKTTFYPFLFTSIGKLNIRVAVLFSL